MANIRTEHARDYVQIANATLRRADLSWQAKGLLAMMLTYPPDWKYNLAHLVKQATNGRESTRSAFRELVEKGFIESTQTRTPEGKLGPMEYVVREIRAAAQKTDDGLPVYGKPATTNT